MTLLHGEHYELQTLEQFKNRVGFSATEIAEAVSEDRRGPDDLLAQINDAAQDWEIGPFDELGDVPDEEVHEWLIAECDEYEMIVATLEQDSRDWVHLYNGMNHDIVQVFD